MFIDSHCHLDFPELSERLPEILQKMQDNQVSHALCVSVTLPEFPNVFARRGASQPVCIGWSTP